MNLETWAAFCIAAGIVLILPGPTIISVVSHSLAHGRKAVIPLVIGVTLGDFTAMTLSLLGLGVILTASAKLFTAVKFLGALYLIYLGIKLFRSEPKAQEITATEGKASAGSLLIKLYVITVLNPKSIAFFVAFLPQFVNPSEQVLPQLFLLGGTFLLLAALNAALYGILAGHLREKVQSAGTRRWFNRCGGGALIGAGFFTALAPRSS
jgi:threonine/homoserine/homoserine lactone efflux protein